MQSDYPARGCIRDVLAHRHTARLKGGTPLPKGVDFYPPAHFEGELSTPTILQVEIEARDPRDLTAVTDFSLTILEPVKKSSLDVDTLKTVVSTPLTIFSAILLYCYARYRVFVHRQGNKLADALCEAANLEYVDFTKFSGDTYNDKMAELQRKLDGLVPNFYNLLTREHQKSFAVCLAEILYRHQLILPSKCCAGTYSLLLCYSEGWSNKLDFDGFEQQLPDIAREVFDTWKAEPNPTERWQYFSRTCVNQLKACCCVCCAKPSHVETRERIKLDEEKGTELTTATGAENPRSVSPARFAASLYSENSSSRRNLDEGAAEQQDQRIEKLEADVAKLREQLALV